MISQQVPVKSFQLLNHPEWLYPASLAAMSTSSTQSIFLALSSSSSSSTAGAARLLFSPFYLVNERPQEVAMQTLSSSPWLPDLIFHLIMKNNLHHRRRASIMGLISTGARAANIN